ncbi:amino-acid permease BAT1 homolog [Setaria viridis]|uniref:amino-acid permease BAT1 homolog n=1 Tax=Setaria viridis TaxID=4556 RepID=UPI003B3AA940
MSWNNPPPAVAADAPGTDHGRLRELGYKQELKRHLSYAAVSPGAVQLLHLLLRHLGADGGHTLYNTSLTFGGPATMALGWFVAGAFTMAVGLSMAEICSAFPTSGGLYYWSARLSGDRWAPFAAWITGW